MAAPKTAAWDVPRAPAGVVLRAGWWLSFSRLLPELDAGYRSLLALWLAAYCFGRVSFANQPLIGVVSTNALVAVLAFVVLLWHGHRLLLALQQPASLSERLQQVESASQVPFQPLTGARLLLPQGASVLSVRLWHIHWQRLADRLRGSNLVWRSGWQDWFRARGGVLLGRLALLAGLWMGLGWPPALRLPALFGASPPVALTAWIESPAYLSAEPVMLSASAGSVPLTVPGGSLLTLRADASRYPPKDSASAPVRRLLAPDGRVKVLEGGAGNLSSGQLKIVQSGVYEFWQGGQRVAGWRIRVVPPDAPAINWRPVPSINVQQQLVLPYQLRDRYGLSNLALVLNPVDKDADGAEAAAIPLFLPLKALSPSDARDKPFEGEVALDLRDHPLAGQAVLVQLQATNVAEAVAATPPVQLILPRRIFTDPLAQAVDEALQQLQKKSYRPEKLVNRLTELQQQLAEAQRGAADYLALQQAARNVRLGTEKTPGETVNLLRKTARSLEDGERGRAADRFAAARQELSAAMRDPSRSAEIPELMQQLAQAWNAYLASSLKNPDAQKARKDGSSTEHSVARHLMQQGNPMPQIMQQLQQALAVGDRARAEQLLQDWQKLADQVKPMPPELAEKMAKADAWAAEMQALVQAQQDLLDQTKQADSARKPLPPAEDQQALHDQLGQLLTKGAELMKALPAAAAKADQAMGQAVQSLAKNAAQPAIVQQQKAVDALKDAQDQAASAMADQLRAEMKKAGIDGVLGGMGATDPFGRSLDGQDGPGDYGKGMEGAVAIPDQAEPRFLRQVLDRLRTRLQHLSGSPSPAEADKPAGKPTPDAVQQERGYLERLLGQ